MDASEQTRVARLVGTVAVCNLCLGVLTALGGLYGIFWATLGQMGVRFQQETTGIRMPEESIATPLYFWVHVLFVAVGVGLVLGAAAMVQRWPGGRALNVFVAAGGIGLFLVAIFGGLLAGPSNWGWALIRLGYLTALVVLLQRRRVKEFWTSASSVELRRPVQASK